MDQAQANSPLDLLNAAGRILVVEPDARALQVIRQGLESVSHHVVSARNAQDAWQILRRENVDMVVSELALPDIHGLKLLERIRQNRDTYTLPFLFLSSQRQPSGRIRALQMGADDFIGKPCVLGELQAKIGTILRRARMLQARGAADAGRGIYGSLDTVSAQELLQFLEQGRKTGMLQVTTPRAVIKVQMQDGQIYSAAFADIEGEEAVFLLFACHEGRFGFRPGLEPTGERNVHCNLQSLLLEGLRMMDETVKLLNDRESSRQQAVEEEDPNATRIVQAPAVPPPPRHRRPAARPSTDTPVVRVRATPPPSNNGESRPTGIRRTPSTDRELDRRTTRRITLRKNDDSKRS
jgi:DNA-binding response OmpR family regulator